MSRLHISLFSFPRLIHGGGFEEYLITLANGLCEIGHQVTIVTADARHHRALAMVLNVYYGVPITHDNSRVSVEQVRQRLRGPRLSEVSLHRMRAALAESDVVYSKNELLDLGVLHLVGLGGIPPVVVGAHTAMWLPRAPTAHARRHNALYLGYVYRHLLRGVSAVHVLNRFDRLLFQVTFRVPRSQIYYIPHPYGTSGEMSERACLVGRPMRVLFAGRLTAQKGIDVLLETINTINQGVEGPSFEFTIAGSGEPRLEAQVREIADLYGNVRYVGHVLHERMVALYRGADAVIVPSNWETGPLACIEPQVLGVPVIASDIPGCRDVVRHGDTGFLFPVGDAAAAAVRLRELRRWQSDAPRAVLRLREHASAVARSRYDPQAVIAAMAEMLQRVSGQ